MVATLQALSDRGGRGDELIAAGEVLNLRFQSGAKSPVLSLRASKLLHFLVNAAGADACELKTHSISAEKLNEQFHLSIEDLLSTVRELFQAVVQLEYRTETGRRVVKTGPMLADVERDLEGDEKDPALIRWEFSPVMRLVMSGSDHWAALSKKAVLAFESRYALRLYEILSLRKNLTHKNTEVFELDDLRQRFGIEPGKLQAFSDFRKYALEPAIAEVNQLTGLRVSYELIKRGRGGKVHSIVLDWKAGTPAERAQVARELEATRVGRKARREGNVDQLSLPDVDPPQVEFPKDGKIRFTAFEAIARVSLPEPLPDLHMVGERFAKWAKAKSIPLRGERVTETFASVCKQWKNES